MSDYTFKFRSHEGTGFDWPISYADIAPYYERWSDSSAWSAMTMRSPTVLRPGVRPAGLSKAELHFKQVIEARWAMQRRWHGLCS